MPTGEVTFEEDTLVSINCRKTKWIGVAPSPILNQGKVIIGLEVGVMWRWVTRGLVVAILATCFPTALLAQDLIAALDQPDPAITWSGMVLIKGWVLDPQQVDKIQVFVDDQFLHEANKGLPRIDVLEAYPNYPGIHNVAP